MARPMLVRQWGRIGPAPWLSNPEWHIREAIRVRDYRTREFVSRLERVLNNYEKQKQKKRKEEEKVLDYKMVLGGKEGWIGDAKDQKKKVWKQWLMKRKKKEI